MNADSRQGEISTRMNTDSIQEGRGILNKNYTDTHGHGGGNFYKVWFVGVGMVMDVLSRQVIDDNTLANSGKKAGARCVKVRPEYKGGKDASLNFLIGLGIGLSCGFEDGGECLKRLING